MCFPSWDSDAMFSSLIGGGGTFAVSPVGRYVWGGYYEEGTLIWRHRWVTDRGAIAAYRNGTAPHPRLPFADWAACADMLARAGRVIVAGCRDAGAARTLGLVPSHNASTALEMARGLAGEGGSTGVLLGPPYPALVVADSAEPRPG